MVTDDGYRPRNPEESLLYQVVAGELETFLASQQDDERNVPGFVEKEFRSFLDCGVLARGFLRITCNTCKLDRDDAAAEDRLMLDTPWLAGLYAYGVRGRIATGPNAGKRVSTSGGSGEFEEPEPSARRCAKVDGFSVHARERPRTQAR